MNKSQAFDQSKKKILTDLNIPGTDKSPKGCIDEPIREMVDRINQTKDFVTTSSCSGRISVFSKESSSFKGGKWLVCEHGTVTVEQILESLKHIEPGHDVLMKAEPFVMHVQARNESSAADLIQCCLASGFRESGILLGRRVMVGIRTTANMLEVPLAINGQLLVSEEFVAHLVEASNTRFNRNQLKIDQFYLNFKEKFPKEEKIIIEKKKESGKFACRDCEETFASRNALFKHIKETHKKDDEHSKNLRNTKSATKAIKSSNSHKCTKCTESFISRNALFKHVRSVHEGKIEIKGSHGMDCCQEHFHCCQACKEGFVSQKILKEHVKKGCKAIRKIESLNVALEVNPDSVNQHAVPMQISGEDRHLRKWGHSYVSLEDGSSYLIGGFGGKILRRTMDVFKRVDDEWIPVPTTNTPQSRVRHSTTVISESKALIFGGHDGPSNILSDVHIIDLESGVWRSLPTSSEDPSPFARYGHSATLIDDNKKIMIIGGKNNEGVVLGDVWILDLDTFVWNQLALSGIPDTVARFLHSASACFDGVLVHGGCQGHEGFTDVVEEKVMCFISAVTGEVLTVEEDSETEGVTRFGHQLIKVKSGIENVELFSVIGGICIPAMAPSTELLQIQRMADKLIAKVSSAKSPISQDGSTCLLHHSATALNKSGTKIGIIGGGGVIFGFGNCFSVPTVLSFSDATSKKKLQKKSSSTTTRKTLTSTTMSSGTRKGVIVNAKFAKTVKSTLEACDALDKSAKVNKGDGKIMFAILSGKERQIPTWLINEKSTLAQLTAMNVICGPSKRTRSQAPSSDDILLKLENEWNEIKIREGIEELIIDDKGIKEDQVEIEIKEEKLITNSEKRESIKQKTGTEGNEEETETGLYAVLCEARNTKPIKSTLETLRLTNKDRRVVKLFNEESLSSIVSCKKVALLKRWKQTSSKLCAIPINKNLDFLPNIVCGSSGPLECTLCVIAEDNVPVTKAVTVKNATEIKLMNAVKDILKDLPEDVQNEMIETLPHQPERIGYELLLLPSDFQTDRWLTVVGKSGTDKLYEVYGKTFNVKCVGKTARIDTSLKRHSRAVLLWKSEAQPNTWMHVRQNGVIYSFDFTKTMFSSGNISEKIRVAKWNCKNETIFDMFTGIGFWTLPMLVHGNAKRVFACDWNEPAIEALKRNLILNDCADRCEVHYGDCVKAAKEMYHKADRVMLGLIPSSEMAWEGAVKALKSTGGWLHVHANCGDKPTDREAFIADLENRLIEIAKDDDRHVTAQCHHLEIVKSYAPHIDHVVADVEIRPL